METKSEKHQQAQDLYLHTGKSQTEIADILNVNRKTLYLWIKNGKWEEMKTTAAQAPGLIVMDIYNHIGAINRKISARDDGYPTVPEVSMLAKLVKMTTVFARNHPGTYIQAFEELVRFIGHKDLDFCKKVVDYADRYVKGSFGDADFHLNRTVAGNIKEVEQRLKELDKETIPELYSFQNPATTTREKHEEGATPPIPPHGNPGTPPAAQMGSQSGMDGVQSGKDGVTVLPPENPAKPATESTQEEISNAAMPQNNPKKENNQGNGASAPEVPNCQIAGLSNAPIAGLKKLVDAPTEIPFPMRMPAGPFRLDFQGYWREDNCYGLPAISGIYCILEAWYDKKSNIINPRKILAIGASGNIKESVNGMLPVAGWHNALNPGNTLCFSYAAVDGEDKLRVAAALVNRQKPPLNKEYTKEFPFGDTTIHITGQSFSMPPSFTVSRNK